MIKLMYRLAFALGSTDWEIEETPAEVLDTLAQFPTGKALDVGCGTGEHSIQMAKQGWQVVGIDFVPRAIHKAQQLAQSENLSEQVKFLTADASRLAEDHFETAEFDFALDLGCFHLLPESAQPGYVAGLSKLVKPGGLLLMKAFTPRSRGSQTTGFTVEAMELFFKEAFVVEKTSDHSYWRFPANWYWFRRK